MAITLPGITILHFRGGRVIERFSQADMLGLLVQMGACRRQPEPGGGLNPPSSGYGRSVCLPTVSRQQAHTCRVAAAGMVAWSPVALLALPVSSLRDGRLH